MYPFFKSVSKYVISIYISCGQRLSSLVRLNELFYKYNILEFTISISACVSDPAPLQFMSVYTGCCIGEWFRDMGLNSLVIYDDLTKHSASYRQMSLLLRRAPGREAYPGDIFYAHARLLERAAQLSQSLGWGSLTALPIVETQVGDISAFVPTNIISITDGQLFLSSDIFFKGIRPALDLTLSVSRVGGQAQKNWFKSLSLDLKSALFFYKEVSAFVQFGGDISSDKRWIESLAFGDRIMKLLNQDIITLYSLEEQFILIYAHLQGYMKSILYNHTICFSKFMLWFFKFYEPKLYPGSISIFSLLTLYFDKNLELRLIRGLFFLTIYYKNLN
jgi:proton translocating ATP synthase F1 alpha subunit